jgi:hypothetical protein
MRRRRGAGLTTLFVALAAAGCTGSAKPALIGADWHDGGQPIATYIAPPAGSVLVYDASLDLSVRDVAAAAEGASALASEHGGYVAAEQWWREGDRLHANLSLAVPTPRFDSLRAAVEALGTVEASRVTGDLVPQYGDPWAMYATLTVHLAPAEPLLRLPELPWTAWRPARTFANAFAVTAAIFAVLLDGLIWLAVVAGPFVALGLGLRALWRRGRGPAR